MPNKKSAIKHLRQTVKRTERNALVKRNIKEIIKRGQKAATKGTLKDEANSLMHALQKAIDKAVKVKILKENTANRKKARFAQMLKKSGASIKEIKSPAKAEDKK
ncbi:MAG: 30S ribosomal protein S20 [Patescibacteria group bacterium]|nr:30S ribosomal protein S20 [Patescibacteria group bacterium]